MAALASAVTAALAGDHQALALSWDSFVARAAAVGVSFVRTPRVRAPTRAE
jgi:hypothetical protein